MPPNSDPVVDMHVIELRDISTRFGQQVVHQGLNLSVRRGEVLVIAGGSGSGKSVLLREMIQLQKPSAGSVRLFGQDLATLSAEQGHALRERWGVMFQKGGLFGALTVLQNAELPLREKHRRSGQPPLADITRIARERLAATGFPAQAADKLPDAISGGMLKRAALARALALDPELVFLDEPTSGLDPASAAGIGELILATRARLHCTMVVISHEVSLLWQVADRVAVLGEGRVLALGPMAELAGNPHPIVQAYFVDVRGPAQAAHAGSSGSSSPAHS